MSRFDYWSGLSIAVSVVAGAILILWLLRFHDAPILGGDGPGYHQLAVNVLDHSSFSGDASPPFEPTMWRTPGYPMFLAFSYSVGARSFLRVRIIQFVVLGLSAWVLYLLGKDLVGQWEARIGSLICATYPPFLFLATYHLTETVATFLGILIVFFLARSLAEDFENSRLLFLTGLSAGLGTLIRPSMALLVLVPMVATWAYRLKHRSQWVFRGTIWLAIGYLICVAPWMARNFMLSRSSVSLATGGGWALYVSSQQYLGEISYKITESEWRRLIDEHVTRNRKTRIETELTTLKIDAQNRAPLSLRQEFAIDHSYEVDAIQKFRQIRLSQFIPNLIARIAYLWSTGDFSPWATGLFHRIMQAHFLGMILLIGAGMWLSRRDFRRHWPLWILPAYLTIIHLVYHVEPRYSFPGRPFLFLFAGVAVMHLVVAIPRSISSAKGPAEEA